MTEKYSTTYRLIPSTIGAVGVVRRTDRKSVQRILLPRKGRSMSELIRKAFPGAVPEKGGGDAISRQLRAFLGGEAVDFSIDELDLDGFGGFARRVLMADHTIPRGRVITYGGLAAKLGVPGGARAVGNVMAGNPFSPRHPLPSGCPERRRPWRIRRRPPDEKGPSGDGGRLLRQQRAGLFRVYPLRFGCLRCTYPIHLLRLLSLRWPRKMKITG